MRTSDRLQAPGLPEPSASAGTSAPSACAGQVRRPQRGAGLVAPTPVLLPPSPHSWHGPAGGPRLCWVCGQGPLQSAAPSPLHRRPGLRARAGNIPCSGDEEGPEEAKVRLTSTSSSVWRFGYASGSVGWVYVTLTATFTTCVLRLGTWAGSSSWRAQGRVAEPGSPEHPVAKTTMRVTPRQRNSRAPRSLGQVGCCPFLL